MQHREEENKRRVYVKPRLRLIELAAEEVLSVGCKKGPRDPNGPAGQGCLNGICSYYPGS